jgi:desulfoferrodoxin-like iron-binding protein
LRCKTKDEKIGIIGGKYRMANEVGKRYVCKKCGAEFIVTRGGKGELHCCGQPMEIKK